MANADALSHLLLPDQPPDSQIPSPGDVDLLLNHLSEAVVTASQSMDGEGPHFVLSTSFDSTWLANIKFRCHSSTIF